jgi:hypothetical protein
MEKLHAMRAPVRAIGRCALVGTLAGLLSTQAFASGLNEAIKTPDQSNPANSTTTGASAITPAAKAPLNFSSTNPLDVNELPPAPEVAKSEAPAPIDPMVAAAAQDGQALTSVPRSSTKKVQRPGMLILGIAGLAPMALGAFFYSYPTKNTGLKAAYGSMFFVPGAAMSGLGFYFAFHQKK